MGKMPYFKWYPSDAATDEIYSAMTDTELGFFHRCLNISWINNGLPSEQSDLCRLMRVTPKYLAEVWPRVGKAFEVSEETGRLVNKRQETERSVARLKSERATDSVRTRYVRRPNVPLRAVARTDCEYGSKVLIEEKNDAMYERYHDFIAAWPENNRRGVDFGAKVWIALVDSGEITAANLKALSDGLERWKASEQWNKDGGKFIPSIADPERHGWLQKRSWKDIPKPAVNGDSW